ncbi:MAG: M20/M25/M40 family metallo-hydrolase [Phototrophicales bacterium]|nr:M20/M25/M40 family metallo-hydrolase [Phototrophicales bacterium]
MTDTTDLYQHPETLLQHLIRFDTTNPPGDESALVHFVAGHLNALGIETTLYEKFPNRPNLVARLQGTGSAPPLLLYGHVDVVTTEGQKWTHPPFSGEIHNGFIWGRGALDMKGGVAMLVAAFMRAKAENLPLAGDLILCLVTDEEAGGDAGAKFMMEEHPEVFAGVKYAIGEFGGFPIPIAGKTFYPIMTSERQLCPIRAIIRGPAGHGSSPIAGSATARLAHFLLALDKTPLPIHLTPIAQKMIETIASNVPDDMRPTFLALLNPQTADEALNQLGDLKRLFNSPLRNTVTPTILRGGNKINVIPSEIIVEMDGRILPTMTPEIFLSQIQAVVGDDIELQVMTFELGPNTHDMGLYDLLAEELHHADDTAIAMPYLLSGVTDARFFAQLGIQTYGYLPMKLPQGFNFATTIHAADERIPVDAVGFGTDIIYRVLGRYAG